MRFNCGPTWQEKIEAKERWHHWFAWYPVRINKRECVWLGRIARKGVYCCAAGYCCWTWTYSPIGAGLDVDP